MKKLHDTVIILNPVSGGGNKSERLEAVKKAALDLKFLGEILTTTKEISAKTLAKKEIKKGRKKIIVGGGDGTIFEVIDELVGKSIVLGIMPLGTGNLFARNLRIPLSIPESLKIALNNKESMIDVGRANGTYFTVIAGLGVDAHIMEKSEGDMKKRFGYFAYVINALKSVFYKNKTYKITIDDKKPQTYKAKSVLIANMDEIQGGLKIVPYANPKSGTLKIGVIKAQSMLNIFDLFLNSAAYQIHKSKHYELLTCKKALVEVQNGTSPFECDGTTFKPVRKLKIEVYPKSLTVAIP